PRFVPGGFFCPVPPGCMCIRREAFVQSPDLGLKTPVERRFCPDENGRSLHHVFIEGRSVFILVGFLIVFFSVFGSFVALGGHLGALYQPFEFVLIAGAALGAYIAANNGKSMKLLVESLPAVFRKSPYSKALYMELMALLYVLLNKARRDGLMSIEADVEEPETSPIFAEYPRVLRDKHLMEFITDYLRLM